MPFRLALVLGLIAVLVCIAATYRRRRARAGAAAPTVPAGSLPQVPEKLLGNAERTWLVFTTPYCATCEPVEARLRAADPDASVLRVDATRELRLAEDFEIRTAPTALLVDASGTVEVSLAGAAAVDRYLTDRQPGATEPRLT